MQALFLSNQKKALLFMAGHGVELQRVIPNVMNGNVRIVAYQNSYYVSEFMALRQSLSDWIFDYLSKHNITSPCRAWIHSLHLKSPPFNFKPLKLEEVGIALRIVPSWI